MIGKSRIYYKNARKVSEQPFLVFLCKLLQKRPFRIQFLYFSVKK